MSTNTTSLNIRMDKELKARLNEICEELGMSVSTAIILSAKAIVRYGGIPFELRAEIPNETTMQAIEDTMAGKNLIGPFNTVEELMESLNAED